MNAKHVQCWLCVLVAVTGGAMANDGVFYASGNGLVPKEETTIELRKEVLKLKRMEKSGFRVGPELGEGSDFVYHFEVPFRKGENRILHTYTYRGGSGVEVVHDFSYRLTTGKTWANGVIGDFTLEIDLGKGAYYAIPASFREDGRLAEWEAIGKSKLSKPITS